MKKILLCLPVLFLFATGFFGCSQNSEWTHEQRQMMREALRNYRQMLYLENLTDDEFMLFTDDVAAQLEGAYPVYTTFMSMPGINDTVDMVVVTAIVDELDADARNMRHLYPYKELVAQGVLPSGLDHEQRHAFYTCFASKVDSAYLTTWDFFMAVMADTTNLSQISQMESQCANSLFNWVFTEVEVIETTDN